MQTDAYVAPARYPLTVLHRSAPPVGRGWLTGIPAPGLTVCGQVMFADELWVPVERRGGDRLCAACCAPGKAAEYTQEALL